MTTRPRLALLLGALLMLPGTVLASQDCRSPAAVCEARSSGSLPLIERGTPLPVLVDEDDFTAVKLAADALRGDLAAVAGRQAPDAAQPKLAFLAGTLGQSARIDRIVHEKNIDASGVAGTGEAYLLEVVEQPEPGIERALVVAGADRRGTAFGLYEL